MSDVERELLTSSANWWQQFWNANNMKPLLVGEQNPYGSHPDYAMYPEPEGCAGHRMCHRVIGLGADDYMERWARINLCPRAWSARVAKANAATILEVWHAPIVMLGSKVSRAFGFGFVPFSHEALPNAGAFRVTLPHPSGLCRIWNEPLAFERAREQLRAVGAIPSGSAVL